MVFGDVVGDREAVRERADVLTGDADGRGPVLQDHVMLAGGSVQLMAECIEAPAAGMSVSERIPHLQSTIGLAAHNGSGKVEVSGTIDCRIEVASEHFGPCDRQQVGRVRVVLARTTCGAG